MQLAMPLAETVVRVAGSSEDIGHAVALILT
ncbi:MAG: hypothetical protein ETSY2_17425 [Candidatus Entotheonella gemina]|uniref:Uncharacterized protein n=1 Tax=Candidatus Entotheonella gemina TaxID=1429439 RepID=W4M8Z9_9BACT|nr:MAG: hypothetical protein ETSY2_17425 [Candidatus Entotheonella gemina]